MQRRSFLASTAAMLQAQGPRPNILWITCEDMSPNLGCYGDSYADTPNLDRFAQGALRYRNAWSCAPVCAPARTTIISGMYPTSTGAEHMRSIAQLAPGQKMFPRILRENGYYTSNNVKEDYNIEHTGKVWDDSSNRAHWRNRAPGQPFFSVFNFVITHESQIRARPHQPVHDPAKVRVPAYHPDTPEVRRDWAQYYDNITAMDKMAAKTLSELEADGLAQDTIVFFYSDHGSGMPRSKRWPYNSGLHVPMMLRAPEKFRALAPNDYRPGGWTDRLVSFVDLAPTVLSVAGVRKADYHQGHAFAGAFNEPEQAYVHGFRGRMDERYDMVRSVRDKRYVYIRNFMPHRVYGQHISYMFETPTTSKWKELHDGGRLNQAQRRFWETKPAEELYDLQADRDEVNNLAASAAHRPVIEKMRRAQRDLALKIRDVGFLPEGEIHARAKGSTPYEMGHDAARYPLERIAAMAETATAAIRPKPAALAAALRDSDPAVRYWAAVGLRISGKTADGGALAALEQALEDRSPWVRIAAAEALGTPKAIDTLLALSDHRKHGIHTALQALYTLDTMGGVSKDRLRALPKQDDSVPQRMRSYLPRLLEHLGAV